MKLHELQKIVNDLCSYGYKDKTVRIKLNEPSVGATATSEVSSVNTGFDWDAGTVFIIAKDAICRKGKSKEDAREVDIFAYSGPRKFYECPSCQNIIKKGSRYCYACGQKLIFNFEREPADSWRRKDTRDE